MKVANRYVARLLCSFAVMPVCITAPSAAISAPMFTATLLQIPGAQLRDVVEINDSGQVSGYAFLGSDDRAFRWSNGSAQLIAPASGYVATQAFAVNNAGTLAGMTIQDGLPVYRPALWTANGLRVDLALGSALRGRAFGLNETGLAVGALEYGPLFGPYTLRATAWIAGVPIDLGVAPGASSSVAEDVNERGQVAGRSGGQAVIWENGAITLLGSGSAQAINDTGHVAGSHLGEAAMWFADTWTQLASLGGSSSANDINNSNDIVGESVDSLGVRRATLWTDGAVLDLNDYLAPGSEAIVGRLSGARSINDLGQILAVGERGWVVLTPNTEPPVSVPTPGSSQLLSLALTVLLASRLATRSTRIARRHLRAAA